MSKLIIISNRLPKTVRKRKGEIIYSRSVGGLATGLGSFLKGENFVWIGWPGIASEKLNKRSKKKMEDELREGGLFPVSLTSTQINEYYRGFCNKSIWPLFHYFPQIAEFNERSWKTYKKVNKLFFRELKKIFEPGDIIWVHDYHLMLLPAMIRDEWKEALVGFFLHIPFPSYETFRLFPQRAEILEGLLGADVIGFHTYDYVSHFLTSQRRILGLEHNLGVLTLSDHLCKVDAFPMGIEYDKFNIGVQQAEVKKEVDKILEKVGDRKIILSIDRLDYTKGILQRLIAYHYFLNERPEYKRNVTMILVAVPSRGKVDKYKEMKIELDGMVGRIEGKFGTIGWMPIWYINRFIPFDRLLALYKASDVCLITPIRDGMNLIAKEYVASKTDGKGVLILSEMAGAAHELGEALIVNPNDHKQVAQAILKALSMRKIEKVTRIRTMQERLRRYNIHRWRKDFIDTLNSIEKKRSDFFAKKMSDIVINKMVSEYNDSKERLILMDYDGTLKEFADRPEDAYPDDEIMDLIKNMVSDRRNRVVMISGRNKESMEEWFGKFNIGLCAEHGIWIRERKERWKMTEKLSNDWKPVIRHLLDSYTDRTPGSFIEEKEHSLAWHFRRTEGDLSLIRSKELIDDLLNLTSNLDLGIMEGDKVIEVRKMGINKGRAAQRFLAENDWKFILAIGNDKTDEDLFETLPAHAYSIKVGMEPSKAKFNLESVEAIRNLLKKLTR
jgi:trehalose 6-phosphate synthase/phosphatase